MTFQLQRVTSTSAGPHAAESLELFALYGSSPSDSVSDPWTNELTLWADFVAEPLESPGER